MRISRISWALMAVAIVPVAAFGQVFSIEMIDHFTQTSAGSLTQASSTPYTFEAHLDTNGVDMSTWAPILTYNGSATSTNFTSTPNNGSNYSVGNNTPFSSASAFGTTFPSGTYGLTTNVGSGSMSVSPSASGFGFTAPRVTSETNGATWSGGILYLNAQGSTTFNFDTFSGYKTSTYGSLVGAGLGLLSTGSAIASDPTTLWITGQSTTSASTSLTVDDTRLTAGTAYTLQIQYGEFAGSPSTTTLGGTTFTEASVYYLQTDITVEVPTGAMPAGGGAGPEPATTAALLGGAALVGYALLRRTSLAA